jgi:hypothetical protein
MVDMKTGHGDRLAGGAPFGCSGRWVFAATEGKGIGEPRDSHRGLHGAAHGLSCLGGNEQRWPW